MAALSLDTCPPLSPAPRAAAGRSFTRRREVADGLLGQLARARTSGDQHAIRRAEHAVIAEFRPLADRVARRYHGRGVDDEDLTQLARVGLVNAVRRWSPQRNGSLVQFAMPTIEGEIKRYFRDHSRPIRMPRPLQAEGAAGQQAAEELRQRWGRAPTDEEIAHAIGSTPRRVREQRLASAVCRPLSVETPSGAQVFGVRCENADRIHDRLDDLISLGTAMHQLGAREKRIIGLRYLSDLTQAQIAGVMGISQMHVSRILRAALDTLRLQMA